jgi:hypothetical protein
MRRLRTAANKQWTSIKRLILIVGECFFRQSSSGLVVVVFTGPGLVTICRHVGRFFGSNKWFLANHGQPAPYPPLAVRARNGRVADDPSGTSRF